ncbi:MAG: DUF1702 family protein [Micromonosporaceae bacterium]
MMSTLGSVRRLMLTPALADVSFQRRGFPASPSAATRHLERIPQAVICGFEWGIDPGPPGELESRLTMLTPELVGFGYEGATMAYTVLDAMRPGRGQRARSLLLGPGQPHIFLAYIGIGFAMARLPRVPWKHVIPDLSGSPYYPEMTWLAVDGYGFDRAYFDTKRWVDQQKRPTPYRWEGSADYFLRAVDQGIGRALWFIHGARPAPVADAVRRFASQRHADLWSGVGLAATFAGGCDSDGLTGLRRLAGEHSAEVAQGAVFAAKARVSSGVIPAYTEVAVAALTDLSAATAGKLADDAAPDGSGVQPRYEQWRRNVRRHFLVP